MRRAHLFLTLATIISFTGTHAKIGYFWHITDFHYDPQYSSQGDTRRQCRRVGERGSAGGAGGGAGTGRPARFGEPACDSPLSLVESAARHMRTRHADNVEFVLWTGDILASRYGADDDQRFQAIRNMTDLLSRTFSSHFVFPVLGHLDPAPSENLTHLWMHWLPLEALQTFTNGGYYTIEQSHSKLRIVALNTNLFSSREAKNPYTELQWQWLEAVLNKADTNKEMVYIVGHVPPGWDGRRSHTAYSPEANSKYLRTVRRHAGIIAGQFFGHLHADTFRVIYENDRAVSWALVAPAVSPRRDAASPANPALRLYKFDTNTGKVLDYTQYYLDLSAANKDDAAEWAPEYNLTQYYAIHEVSAPTLHALADKLRIGSPHDMTTFQRYSRAYNVKYESTEICDGACAHQHFCAVTCLEYVAYRQCVEAAASALAAAAADASLVAPLASLTGASLVVVILSITLH